MFWGGDKYLCERSFAFEPLQTGGRGAHSFALQFQVGAHHFGDDVFRWRADLHPLDLLAVGVLIDGRYGHFVVDVICQSAAVRLVQNGGQ